MSNSAKNAMVVGFMTFISRIGGLIRDVLMAHFFGTSVLKSAFDVAYRIPNLFRRLFGEGALSAALVPIYTETLAVDGKDEANRLASAVATVVLALLGAISALGILLTYFLASANIDQRWLAIFPLLRIMLPYAPLICLAALIMGILNSLKSFAVSALAPAFQNLCWIGVLVLVCPFLPENGDFRIKAVSWAILVSGFVQVAVQLPVLRRHGVSLRLALPWPPSEAVKRVFALTAPMAFSAGLVQFNVALDHFLAMKAGVWGPSALSYADRIIYLPLAVIATAFSTVLLPELSSLAAVKDYDSFRTAFSRSVRDVILAMTPASFGLMALAYPVVYLIFKSGAFDEVSTRHTAAALIAYAAGLLPAGLHKIAVTAFFARKETRPPVLVGTIGVFLNFSMNLFFIWILPEDIKPVGIAIATAISSTLAVIALFTILARRRLGESAIFSISSVLRVSAASLVASAVMAVVCKYAADFISTAFGESGGSKLVFAVALAVTIPLGATIYFCVMRLACPNAMRELCNDILSRKRRHKKGSNNG